MPVNSLNGSSIARALAKGALLLALLWLLAPGLSAMAQEGQSQSQALVLESPQPGGATEGAQPDGAQAQGPFTATDLAPVGAQAAQGQAPLARPPAGIPEPALPPGGALPAVDVIKAAGAFVLVIALLVIFLKLLAYLSKGRKLAKGGRAFTLRGTMVLDSRRYLAAFEIDGRLLVVGVTPDRLTALANWPLADEEGNDFGPLAQDAVEGPKALATPRPQPREPLGSKPEAQAPAASPQGSSRARPVARPLATPTTPTPTSVAQLAAANTSERSLSLGKAPAAPQAGPSMGPGIKAGLGADPRTAPTDDGPVLDLSLDDESYDGPDANDSFLGVFGDRDHKE
ncbi:MAG: flagellar biosynthetic protein FliO [Deltaproteobacteria bacterium]|nr:flagellar biosynthetic protein FliO [Deltaproteobacteria bacterium]